MAQNRVKLKYMQKRSKLVACIKLEFLKEKIQRLREEAIIKGYNDIIIFFRIVKKYQSLEPEISLNLRQVKEQ